ncbi:hypothetical protein A1O3_08677 [Capronia epimyces CBS 606.96]|uniref:DUF1445 domain protein n=1 Tax=Capronia epimyces CBS 606.96 TaxID=1182542 RepID=W9XQB5_9EURO|nr:uncharacterized protein A1O3_08677 [Capronia epimyces CBS 606.96]EXJ79176.1 hypothetical protein A1O3_08677 [Capronia epimyces CBS 606.96]
MAPIALDEGVEVAKPQRSINTKSATEETGEQVRLAARAGKYTSQTSGAAPTYIQANFIVLPSRYAADFRLLCRRNPVPCPLLAESKEVGRWDQLKSWVDGLTGDQIAKDLDLRHDFPKFMVYENGDLTKAHCLNVEAEWTEDHVGFLIGCSYSFENALASAGLIPAHTAHGRNAPMYRTNIPLCPAGIFKHTTYVVSMRPYRRRDVERVREITRPYVATHGEPIDWGWDAVGRLGIQDISQPDYGEAPVAMDGSPLVEGVGADDDELVPVFWGCGVTPQEAIRRVKPEGRVIGHAPGYMIVLDIRDQDIIPKQ